jgi:hypothetical protein
MAPRSSIITLPASTGGPPPTIRQTLEHQVAALLEAHRRRTPEAATLLRGHGVGKGTDEEISGMPLALETASQVIANEHEFKEWSLAMREGDVPIDLVFESAVDAVVNGDVAALRVLLGDHPDLAHRTSVFGHRVTLLHYVAANGVEQTRQHSPPNAPDVARMLLEAGAAPDAGSLSYGGPAATTMELLLSSCHPAAAGVQEDIVEVLCQYGAKVEGPRGDGSPLWTALTWGYLHAAERLVKCGARVDNVIAAAALGALDDVRSYFGEDGRLRPVTALRGGACFSHGRPYDLRNLLEYTLIEAAGAGRRDIVEFLLTKGPDLSVREPVYKNTALDAASYPHPAAGYPEGHPEMVALLKSRGA